MGTQTVVLNTKDMTLQQKSLAVAVLRLDEKPQSPTTGQLGGEQIHYSSYSLDLRTRKLGYDGANSALRRLEARGVVTAVVGAGPRRWKVALEALDEVRAWQSYLDRVAVTR
ncbi:MAG: hypothetical protein ABW167_07795 [Baekduia sp.]